MSDTLDLHELETSLLKKIASGVLEIEYQDKRQKDQTTDNLIKAFDLIRKRQKAGAVPCVFTRPAFDKGL